MKTRLVLFFAMALLSLQSVYSQDECFPNQEGLFEYYVNLNLPEISNDFNLDDFFALVEGQTSSEVIAYLGATMIDAIKSFPTAETPMLQQTITVFATNNDLESYFSEIPEMVNFAEFLCSPEEMLTYTPNDYTIIAHDASTHLDLIKAPQAWEITRSDPRIKIGITDTHIEVSHEDLENKIDQILHNSSSGFHGVAVSGMAAADTDNDLGIASIGFDSKIVFSSWWANDSEVLRMAQIPGVRTINMSWVNRCSPSVTQEAVYDEVLYIHNVVAVAGAGNDRRHCGRDNYVYPASYESVISVSSVGHLFDYGYEHPQYGEYNWIDCHQEVNGADESTHHHNDRVNICAPGYAVYSTKDNNGYGRAWGTSFAAPQVAAVCGLVAAVNPCLSAVEIRDIVLSTADPSIYQLECNQDYIGLLGTGRLDAYEAVKKAMEQSSIYVQNTVYGTGTTATENAGTLMFAGSQVTNTLPFGLVRVETGSDVTFQATRTITLGEGLRVENGAVFTIETIDSSCF